MASHSEGFEVPSEIVAKIDEMFPSSVERRKIAYTLMFWNRKPNTSEQTEIGEKVERDRSTVNIVMRNLIEKGLMTEEFGSVPLFRYTEKNKLSTDTLSPNSTNIPTELETLEPDLSDLTNEEEAPIIEAESQSLENPLGVEKPVGPALERRIALQEADLNEVKSNMKEIKEMINKLVGGAYANPSTPPIEVIGPLPSQDVENPESVQDIIKRTVLDTINTMQEDSPAPVLVETENPETLNIGEVRANPNELIELRGQLISNRLIGFNSKSMILFDISKVEGMPGQNEPFAGNISDFVNACINDTFKGRRLRLTLVDEREIF